MINESGTVFVPPSGEVMLERLGVAGEAVAARLREAHDAAIEAILELVAGVDEPDVERIRSTWSEQIDALLAASVELDVIRLARLRLDARLRRIADPDG
jgi:hypothetical protein